MFLPSRHVWRSFLWSGLAVSSPNWRYIQLLHHWQMDLEAKQKCPRASIYLFLCSCIVSLKSVVSTRPFSDFLPFTWRRHGCENSPLRATKTFNLETDNVTWLTFQSLHFSLLFSNKSKVHLTSALVWNYMILQSLWFSYAHQVFQWKPDFSSPRECQWYYNRPITG